LPLTYINSSSLDSIRNDISNVRWAEVLSHADVNTSFEVFVSFLSTIVGKCAKTRVQSSYRLPWYTKGLKKYKHTRYKFYKRCIENGDAADFDRYKQHEFEFLRNSFTANILLI